MGRVRVRYNRLPAIMKELPRKIDGAVDEEARIMAQELEQAVWFRYGYVKDATSARTRGRYHAEVWCGLNRSTGFYSRFQEWGTVNQQRRPVVGPTAHAHEPIYARRMTKAVRDACDAR